MVRVVTEDNRRIVGVRVPNNRVQQIFALWESLLPSPTQKKSLMQFLPTTIRLLWSKVSPSPRSKIQGTQYVELRGVTSHKFDELRGFGLLNMKIEFRERFLLPDDPDLALARP